MQVSFTLHIIKIWQKTNGEEEEDKNTIKIYPGLKAKPPFFMIKNNKSNLNFVIINCKTLKRNLQITTWLQLLGSILFFLTKGRRKRSWLLWLPWAYKAYHVILSSSMDGIVWPEFIWIWGTTPHVGYACTLLVLPLLSEAFIWLFAFPQYQDFQTSKY